MQPGSPNNAIRSEKTAAVWSETDTSEWDALNMKQLGANKRDDISPQTFSFCPSVAVSVARTELQHLAFRPQAPQNVQERISHGISLLIAQVKHETFFTTLFLRRHQHVHHVLRRALHQGKRRQYARYPCQGQVGMHIEKNCTIVGI